MKNITFIDTSFKKKKSSCTTISHIKGFRIEDSFGESYVCGENFTFILLKYFK